MGQALIVTVPCSRAHRHGSCLNEMLLRTMRWPHKAVSRTIILQLAEKEQHLIFEKEDFPSEHSDDINPLWLKLNLAAVVLLCRIKDWTSWHILPVPVWAQHRAVYSQADSQTFFSLPVIVYNKKDIGLMLPRAWFKCLTLQKLWDTSVSTLTKGRLCLQTDFQYKHGDSRDRSLQFSGSSAELPP